MVVRKRLDIKGSAIAFITTTVYEWKHLLTNPLVTPVIIAEINNLSRIYDVSIIGYVVMPSHIHLILGFPKIEALSTTLQSFKSISSRKVKDLKLFELKENGYTLMETEIR